MAQTLVNGCIIVFKAETFTGDVSTAATLDVVAGARLQVLAWDLAVTGNSALVECSIEASGGTTYATTKIPITANGGTRNWVGPVGGPAAFPRLPDGEELVIAGGGTSGVLDGYVVVQVS